MHILSAKQFSKEEILKILDEAANMEKQTLSGKIKKVLDGKIVACIFFEPSTRTRLSFETAALRLGAQIISAENAMENTSTHKGESLEDTTKILNCYTDAIVMRHPKEGSAERAAKVSLKPVINAGDGGNQHPSQALLDLYTIKKRFGRLDNLKIAFGFDPKHSRTIKSLSFLLTHFKNNSFTFICPNVLKLPDEDIKILKDRGAKIESRDNLANFGGYDIFYANRLQEERFEDKNEFEKYKKSLVITKNVAQGTKTLIMDPLPRIDEIGPDVDGMENLIIFEQAQNGLYVRMALLKTVMIP
jgi:aspartate carbamoyltransferase catalytic subunit